MSDPEISIVIVSWNVRDQLVDCLRSIQKFVQTAHEVIVVDNHSSDDTLEVIQREFPRVTMIVNERNAGFSRANNQGWQKARGRYLCFLNPDTVFIDDPFPALLTEFQRPRVGCAAPQLLNPDGSHQPSVRRFPRLFDQALVLVKLRRLDRWLSPLRAYQGHEQTDSASRSVDQVMGAAMVVPRMIMTEIGSFDEGYWIWFEEVDFCQRLRRQGYEVRYVPSARIIHLGGQSFRQHYSLAKHVWFMKSLGRYVRKYWSPLPRYVLYVLMPISYLLTMIQSFIKPR